MPLGAGVKYRVMKRGGHSIRLAFRGDTVVEAKNLETGETRTETGCCGKMEMEARRRMKARRHMRGSR